MQRKRKDDTDRFMQAIAAFSAAPEDVTVRGRRLQGGAHGAVHAILSEVDETVLHRHLEFATEQGKKIVLDVGERRLLNILSTPSEVSKAFVSVVGRPLEDADADIVLRLLAECVASETEIFVRSRPVAESEADVFRGLSAKTLLEHQVAPVREGLPDALLHAIETSKSTCKAMVAYRSGQPLFGQGDKGLCDKLGLYLSTLEPQSKANHSLTLWCSDPSDDLAILLVDAGEFRIALSGSVKSIKDDFASWRNAAVG